MWVPKDDQKLTLSPLLSSVVIDYFFFFNLGEESRGDKMWVPKDAIAHLHSAYVGDTWPGKNRMNFFIGSCPS